MKKTIIVLCTLCLLVSGCSKNSQKDITKEITNKLDKCSGYKLNGKLSITNNDEIYVYNVEVGYKKDDNYRVTLTNISNNHTQIILKNENGVYVLTPSLNKSFKFQSDWPYNNSQIYLLNAIINDMNKDEEISFSFKNGEYVFNTSVDYPNNSKLVKQKITFDKDLKLKQVIVYDKDGLEKMTMEFNKISYSPKFSKNYFELDSIIDNDKMLEDSENDGECIGNDCDKDDTNDNDSLNNDAMIKETSSIDDVIYPLFLPNGTKLIDEERVAKETGERIIMTYDGEKSFVLVEETLDVFNEFTVIPSSGEPYQLLDSLGVMTDNSLSWTSGNIEYYLVSDVMSKDEMIEVAQSIVGVASLK